MCVCLLQDELVCLANGRLTKPGTWTWGDVSTAAVVGAQIAGAFCVGEIIGRGGEVIGYPQGKGHGH